MKKTINSICMASVVTASLLLSACSDFLDKEPLAQGTEAITFHTPEQFEQAANALYNTDGWKDLNGTAYTNMDKNLDISGLGSNGGGSAPEGDWRWDKIYGHIRTSNVLLEKAEDYGDKDAIAASIGTAYFFRAWQYFTLLKTFGGVPLIDHAPDMSDEVLYAPRNSRYEVAEFISSDLEKAIPLLPLEQDIPELADVRVIIGYTNRNEPSDYPGDRQFSSLLKKYDAADIWRTILWRALAAQPEAAPYCPFIASSWEEDVAAAAQSPEAVDRFLFAANKALAAAGTRLLVLFDALDRVAETWNDIDALTTALLRTTLQLSTYSHIKGKIFLREDHCNRLAFTFPDASKLLATRVELSWKRAELYGLLWKRLCNVAGEGGRVLRDVFAHYLPGGLVEKDGFWLFSRTAELTDDTFRPLFHALTGPFMGKDKRRGVPYIWTVGHLADARQQTSPRSFLVAIRHACDDSRENHSRAEYAIHYESITQ